jgi:tRNA(adenine34) deaminase
MSKIDDFYMAEALKEAIKAFEEDEVPVGCVIVHNNRIISRAHNEVEKLKDPTAHAEMLALTSATHLLNSKWLNGAKLYVTIEPCSMCAGAIVLARITSVFYGADDPKTGACGSIFNILNHKKLNHRVKTTKGILKKECGSLISDFFKKKRVQEN